SLEKTTKKGKFLEPGGTLMSSVSQPFLWLSTITSSLFLLLVESALTHRFTALDTSKVSQPSSRMS
ncbi:hypothetical protein NL493_29215, partial [Klebsiella pneumoniae]|nr:hypothetical protein [Klebsiella pneumoniae]